MKAWDRLFLGLMFLLAGCSSGGGKYVPLLDAAERYLPQQPDSARLLLDSVAKAEHLPDAVFVRWCMLSGQVTDITHEGLLPVYRWERARWWLLKHGTVEQQAQVSLYLGRAYAEDGEYDHAMQIYSEALHLAKENEVYNVAGYICTYMADLYSHRNLTEEVMKKYEEAIECFDKAGNRKSQAYALKNLAAEYAFGNSFEQADSLMIKADSIARILNNASLTYSINNAYANVYFDNKQYEKSEYYFTLAHETAPWSGFENCYGLILACVENGKLLKAKNLVSQLLECDSSRFGINDALYRIYKKEGNYEKALKYHEVCSEIIDSLTDLENHSRVLEIEKKYNNLKLREKNAHLMILQQRSHILLGAGVVVIVFLLLSFLLYRQRVKVRIYKKDIRLNEMSVELLNLSNELNRKQKVLEDMNKKHAVYAELSVRLKQEITLLKDRYKQLQKQRFETSAIYKKLQTISRDHTPGRKGALLTDKMWKALVKEILQIYPDFHIRIYERSPLLTDSEWCYACLQIFGFDTNEEAKLLGIAPGSVSTRRNRLKQ